MSFDLRSRAIALAFAATLLPFDVLAQGESPRGTEVEAIPLEDLRLSAPPALTLLGIAAASVARPNTPRDLIASLVSAAGSEGVVPNGYALETAPFWLVRHPALELREYYAAPLADRLKYFTSFSAATSRPTSRRDTVAGDAHVAIAIRTLLLNGRPSPGLLATAKSMRALQVSYISDYAKWETAKSAAPSLAALRQRLRRQEELLSSLTTRVLVGPEASLRDSTLRTLARRDSALALVAAGEAAEKRTEELESDLDALERRLGTLAKSFASQDLEPDGLVLEVAAGTRAAFGEGDWSRERVDGAGLWITPMYRLASHHLEIIATGRYLARVREYGSRDLFDLGARIGKDIGKASLSAEYVRRTLSGSEAADVGAPPSRARRSSSRWAALFTCPLGGKLHAVASFGSDFRRPLGERPVIATIGLNLGVGAVMIVSSSSNAGL